MKLVQRAAPFGCLMAFGALALAGCTGSSSTGNNADATAALTVTTTRPQTLSWPVQLTANGSLQAWQEMVISAETGPYRIATLQADVGTWARKGQILATLATDSLQADRARLTASISEAQANLAKANSDVERARQVGDSGALSAQQIESYRVAQQTAQASLASAQAQLRGVLVQLGQTNVRAADDGVVSTRSAVLGKVVSAGEEMFRLVRQGKVEWQAELDAQQLTRVTPGQLGRVTLPGGQVVEGRVRLVSPTLNGNTSRGVAYVALPARSAAKAGMYGSGTIEVGSANVLTVPDGAVVLRDGRSYVFLLQGNRVQQKQVTAGQRRDGRVEVSGIPADAELVASGGAFLSDGVTVRIEQAAKK